MTRKASAIVLITGTLLGVTGCPQYHDSSVPNEIARLSDPASGADYLLYVPSTYDKGEQWPLIILCHGTRPWDTARRQIRDWVQLSEEHGFIVAAPYLRGTSAVPMPAIAKQMKKQREDERRILGVVRHVRAGHNISSDRIFLTGWSAGSFAVLHTGLANPTVFRAIAVQQGNFKAAYFADVKDRIDSHQPVGVIHGSMDLLTGRDAKVCIDWLEKNNVNLHRLRVFGGHRSHPVPVLTFFENVVEREPWLHIRTLGVEDGDDMTARFKIRSSFKPEQYEWDFGDGEDSPAAEPIHRYEHPGEYVVTLTVVAPGGKRMSRSTLFRVPHFEAITPKRSSWNDG